MLVLKAMNEQSARVERMSTQQRTFWSAAQSWRVTHGVCLNRSRKGRFKALTPTLKIPVPLGTVVKRKRGSALMGELVNPGQTLIVARGGKGGMGVVRPGSEQAGRKRLVDEVASSVASASQMP
jgi:GTPase involved in cell partitioning and DNA repair